MPSWSSKEGYLLIDHSASPGIDPDYFRKEWPTKRMAPPVPEGKIFEAPTKRCCHCNHVVIINPDRIRPRGYCRKCDGYICDKPECRKDCTPFRKIMELAEKETLILQRNPELNTNITLEMLRRTING